MARLRDLLKYNPPDFQIFQKWGSGYLWQAFNGITQANHGLLRTLQEKRGPGGLKAWPGQRRGESEHDLLDVYAGWTKADDMLRRLEGMPAEEREKHLVLDTRDVLDYDEVVKDFAELTGEIAAMEIEGGDQYQEVLNGLLQRRIDEWENDYLPYAENVGFEYTDPMTDPGDFCEERTTMEYALTGIHMLKYSGYASEPELQRLRKLPFYDTFVERVHASDDRFRKALKGERCVLPWADESFWWHQPLEKDSKDKK
jgi:hypothetical protein